MLVRLNFNVQAWIDGLEIEADSIEEAKEKLYKMDVIDMINEGYIKESDVDDVDAEVLEVNYKIRAYNINYCIEAEDVDDGEEELSDEEIEKRIADVASDLPKELILEFTCEPDDLEDYIADEISDETDWLVEGFDYEILEEK